MKTKFISVNRGVVRNGFPLKTDTVNFWRGTFHKQSTLPLCISMRRGAGRVLGGVILNNTSNALLWQ